MSAKTLSVIITNYNDAHYLKGALEDVLNQSFKAAEVFVADDCSTDDSVALIESFARRDPTVKLLRNDRNRGNLYSVNRALAIATGDYVATLTADDRILPGLFERSMALLEKHPQAGLCSALTRLMGANGEDLGPYLTPVISKEECFIPPEKIFETFKKFGAWIMTHTVLFKRTALLEAGGFDLTLRGTSDTFLFHTITVRHGACFIPEPLAVWRKVEARDRDHSEAEPLFNYLEKRLREQNIFPLDYLDFWKRHSLFARIYETSVRWPYRFDEILRLQQKFPKLTLTDRAFRFALRLCLFFARRLTKLYVFAQHRPIDKYQIVTRKIKNRLGGR